MSLKAPLGDNRTPTRLAGQMDVNNGGFASVRTKKKKLGLEKGDTLVVKVRGDGREYEMNLYVPTIQIAYSYRAVFQPQKDEWIEIKLP